MGVKCNFGTAHTVNHFNKTGVSIIFIFKWTFFGTPVEFYKFL